MCVHERKRRERGGESEQLWGLWHLMGSRPPVQKHSANQQNTHAKKTQVTYSDGRADDWEG